MVPVPSDFAASRSRCSSRQRRLPGSARPCTSGANGSKLYGPSNPIGDERPDLRHVLQPVAAVDEHPVRVEHGLDGDVGIDDARDVDDAGPLRERTRSRLRDGGGRCRARAGRRRRRPPRRSRRRASALVRSEEIGKPRGSTSPISPRVPQDRRHRLQRRDEIGVRRPACRRSAGTSPAPSRRRPRHSRPSRPRGPAGRPTRR